ncbi:MAG TPA: c-type cytochrome [Terriglobia bacterium]|nr:c-type cytochrome [Terriglobia bacterium]
MKSRMRTLTILMLTTIGTVLSTAQSPPPRFGLGQPASADLIAAWDIAVMPDGKGLPPGKGTPAEGATIYAAQCASCHGANGEGGVADVLVGPEPKGFAPFGPQYEKFRGDAKDVPFTIGNYWPYATTIFDYIRRAMPPNAAGSLKADQVYSLTAFLLAKNGIIAENAVIDAKTLPAVMMPARNRFVPDDRAGGAKVK